MNEYRLFLSKKKTSSCVTSLFFKKNILKKLILIAFEFGVKIYLFDKMIFIKILNKHLKMTKMIFFYKKKIFFQNNPKQTHL